MSEIEHYMSIPVSEFDALHDRIKQAERLYQEANDEAIRLHNRLVQAEKLAEALGDAIWAADFLAGQQAMPDDGYKARLESAREILAAYEEEQK